MLQISRLPDDHDGQVEWFHVLATTLDVEGTECLEPAVQEDLVSFLALQLPGFAVPAKLTYTEFSELVVSLRKNEILWNQALMRTIIVAEDRAEAGQARQAAEDLRSFAASCP